MPTDIEARVIALLGEIELSENAARAVEKWGNEAVTVACDAALGSYVSLRRKIRTNAVSLVAEMEHPQAVETTALLIADADPDIAIRAIRGAGRQKKAEGIERLGRVLRRRTSDPLVAAEALHALMAIDLPAAQAHVEAYASTSAERLPHRAAPAVEQVLRTRPRVEKR